MTKYVPVVSSKLVYSGHNFFEILEQIIDESRETLHLQTYIFATDSTGINIINALKRAAARHVKVYVLADAFGSYPFDEKIIHELTQCGIHFRLFSPLFSSESIFFGRRLHHKIVVADKNTALVGGMNIADKYRGADARPWLDYAVLTKGKTCEYLHLLCEQIYNKRLSAKKLKAWEAAIEKPVFAEYLSLIRFCRNDFIKRKNEIYTSYKTAISKAEQSITIVASYFLPGKELRKLLTAAALRGVEIRIILAGQSDISSVRLAENYLYTFYLKNNIQLYEWTNSVMHGKAMLVDDKWATIGSYNLNYLSRYISIELNADVIDEEFVKEFSAHLSDIITNNCNPIKKDYVLKRATWLRKTKMWLAYYFYKFLMEIMTNRKNRK